MQLKSLLLMRCSTQNLGGTPEFLPSKTTDKSLIDIAHNFSDPNNSDKVSQNHGGACLSRGPTGPRPPAAPDLSLDGPGGTAGGRGRAGRRCRRGGEREIPIARLDVSKRVTRTQPVGAPSADGYPARSTPSNPPESVPGRSSGVCLVGLCRAVARTWRPGTT